MRDQAPMDSVRLETPATLEGIDDACRTGMEFLAGKHVMDKSEAFVLELLIREALANTVTHGNESEDPAVTVEMRLSVDQDSVIIEVADKGPGFDWRAVLAKPMDLDGESGRGLAIYRHYADDFSFNEIGNAITLRRKRRK